MSLEERLLGVTTLIHTSFDVESSATGFFYHQLDETGNSPGWREIKNTWLVTNRHVVLHEIDRSPTTAKSLSFGFRHRAPDWLEWDSIQVNHQQLLERTLFHQNSNVDISIIRISDLFLDRVNENLGNFVREYAVTNGMLPGRSYGRVQVSDDVLVLGYPNGYYDEFNLFPIVKSGIIASIYGKNFNDEPCFLIDAKLLPGSSGSLVISKPIDFMIEEGVQKYSKEKQYLFLGVYSANLHDRPPLYEYNLGKVWYGQLIDEIATQGIKYDQIDNTPVPS
jgi:hypothetical protein